MGRTHGDEPITSTSLSSFGDGATPYDELLVVPRTFRAAVRLGQRLIRMDEICGSPRLLSVRLPFLNRAKRFRLWGRLLVPAGGDDEGLVSVSDWSQTIRLLQPIHNTVADDYMPDSLPMIRSSLALRWYSDLHVEIESPKGVEYMDMDLFYANQPDFHVMTMVVETLDVRRHEGLEPSGGWKTRLVDR